MQAENRNKSYTGPHRAAPRAPKEAIMMRCDLQLDESKRFYLLASDADPECGMNRLNPGCYLMRGDNDGLGVLFVLPLLVQRS